MRRELLCLAAVGNCLGAMLGGCAATAQVPEASATSQLSGLRPPIELLQNDVSFYERLFPAGPYKNWSGMCGFVIQGNLRSQEIPRPQWLIDIAEFMDGDKHVVGVRAMAFDVVSNARDAPRRPRSPITALSFTFDGESEPLAAHIIGQTGRDPMAATLETAPGRKLLEAFYDAQPIRISLTHQDGATEMLEVRNWADRGDYVGLNGYLHQCLEHLRAVPPGATESTYTLSSPDSPAETGLPMIMFDR